MNDSKVRWLSSDESETWRSFLHLNAILGVKLEHDLTSNHGLTLAEYEVLVHLSEADDFTLRMSSLADLCYVSRSGLTRRLDSLIKAGMVVKRTCPSDRRGMNAVLTAKGLDKIRSAAPTHVSGVRQYFLDLLDGDEVKRLGELVSKPLLKLLDKPISDDCKQESCLEGR
ncbi:MAG: MarR family transcriptional regulator [Actinomycetota bacterium]|nr:MarR family transcriptional regulator [Actinomycetota bacterium]